MNKVHTSKISPETISMKFISADGRERAMLAKVVSKKIVSDVGIVVNLS
jgi:hypothetical protein